jgi:hypothetical protein
MQGGKEMSEENLKVWNELKAVPAAAKKKILGGRLKGMTDIKPQWRLKMMTEQFGPIGIGWYYEPVERWTESYGTEISVHIRLNVYVKVDGEWSKPISGTGGSMLIANEKIYDNEKNLYDTHFKPYHSDEAYKMATTDALSVAMKQLGVAADVYMGLSDSKYDKPEDNSTKPPQEPSTQKFENYQKMTGKQKGILRDQIIELEKVGSKSCKKAITAINTFLGNPDSSFEEAVHLINKCNTTIEASK